MDERLKLLMLLNCVSLGAQAAAKFLGVAARPSELWSPSGIDAALAAGLPEAKVARIRELNREAWAERELEAADKMGVRVMTAEDDDYPSELQSLGAAIPVILYVRGSISRIADRKIGIVGTRRATRYGRDAAARIGRLCGENGLAVVSGGAWGVDCISQGAALEAGGISFAVLGTGVDVAYPAANRTLFDKIAEGGALISEFPLGSNGEPWHFPQRNRIVAALSEKLVVVEAPEKSGSMITARLALDLGIEVWAVPGEIYNENAQGVNRLIFDGAYPYINDDCFLSACGVKRMEGQRAGAEKAQLPADEGRVYELLRLNGPQTVDGISASTGIGTAELFKIMAIMSAKGLVCLSSPGRYNIKNML